jgi:hypothetical protein
MTTRRDEQARAYAVIWRTGAGPVKPGKLVLGATGLRLETGAPGGRLTTEGIRYADVASVENALSGERLHGRPTTLVRCRERAPVAIAALDHPGSAHEIAERLAREVP